MDYVDGEVVVGLTGPAPDTLAAVDAMGRAVELPLERIVHRDRVGLYRLPPNLSVPDAIVQLQTTGQHRWVEPNFIVHGLGSTSAPNDPDYSLQWHLPAVDAESAWAGATGEGIIVAVLDTGVTVHATDGPTNLEEGVSCIDGCEDGTSSEDDGKHGSHMAAVIGQETNNGVGAAGLAYGASILPVRVLSTDIFGETTGTSADIAEGIMWAVGHDAQVINLSLGTSHDSRLLAEVITNDGKDPDEEEETETGTPPSLGVLFVAAAGNEGEENLWWPAAHPSVLAVGSTNNAGSLSVTSNWGCGMDLVAPGGEKDGGTSGMVKQWIASGRYGWWGTSVSAAMVSASAALVWSAHPDASADEVRDALLATAEDLGSSGYDTTYGYGLVQPAAAIAALDAGSASTDDMTCTVKASTGSVSCGTGTSPITRVSTSSGLTLRLNMSGYKDLQIEGDLASASGWALNLADSSTNDGYCGDSGTTMYDAEAWILSSGFYVCDSDMGGSDYEVNKPSAVTTSSDQISLEVCDGELSFLSETTAATLDSSTAFQFGGDEKDSRGVTNDQYLYLGIKRVVRTTSRSGAGADELTLRFVR